MDSSAELEFLFFTFAESHMHGKGKCNFLSPIGHSIRIACSDVGDIIHIVPSLVWSIREIPKHHTSLIELISSMNPTLISLCFYDSVTLANPRHESIDVALEPYANDLYRFVLSLDLFRYVLWCTAKGTYSETLEFQ